ncbi:hypothetical protein Ahia01_001285500, partial [Argonauta hians]
ELKYKHKGQQKILIFHVLRTVSEPILGLQASLELKLVKLLLSISEKTEHMTQDSVRTDYAHLFRGMGNLGEAKIIIRKDATPMVDAPRRVPIAVKDKLKVELDRMEKQGVIAKVLQ